ncbi:hypothetical protein AQ611_22955 [Burkholderia singularis]|nr:hypothetical protein AQ611_22955 [Burkholderia sp. Bp7605]
MKRMSGMIAATAAIALDEAAPHTGPAHAWPDRGPPSIVARAAAAAARKLDARSWRRDDAGLACAPRMRGLWRAIVALVDAHQMRGPRLPGS